MSFSLPHTTRNSSPRCRRPGGRGPKRAIMRSVPAGPGWCGPRQKIQNRDDRDNRDCRDIKDMKSRADTRFILSLASLLSLWSLFGFSCRGHGGAPPRVC